MSLGRSIRDGALTVVEQIPGLVLHSDQTQALRQGKRQSCQSFELYKVELVVSDGFYAMLIDPLGLIKSYWNELHMLPPNFII